MFTQSLFHKPPSDLHLSKYFVWPKRKLAMAKNNFKTYIINNICTYTSTTTTQFLNVFFTRKPFDILLNPLSFFCYTQLADENRRLEKLLKVKEAQICESETKAKELSLRAEEFEELFNGQLASVKALQSDLSVASNENKALVKEMEMLNQMFNAMEKHYVNQALTEYKAQVGKLSLSSFTFFRTTNYYF